MHKIISLLSVLMIGCGSVERIPFESDLPARQPQVIAITPPDGALSDSTAVEAVFNQPIDPKSVTAKSFAITAVEEGEVDVGDLWKEVGRGNLEVVPGDFEFSEDQTMVRFVASAPFPPEVRCGVILTPEILSVDRLPLNQTPGEGPKPFFSSFYTPLGGAVAGETAGAAAALPRPAFLRLNEVFYDATGSDTNGDLFIELYGEAERNLSGSQILLIRGSDGAIRSRLIVPNGMQTDADGFFVVADAVTGSPGVTHVAAADWVVNFDPANGPDCVQLLDPDGNLVDAIGYGEPLVVRAQNNFFCYEGSPAPDAPAGSSLTRLSGAEDADDNALDWQVTDRLTPGGPFEAGEGGRDEGAAAN